MASIRPAPKVGVGIRNTMLRLPPCPETGSPAGRKDGCAMLQLLPASLRPVITKRLCTPPSATPLVWTKRASRIGPFCASNQGMRFIAPDSAAMANSGFTGGLDPPTNGCAWQDEQELELNLGPSPLPCVDVAPETTSST